MQYGVAGPDPSPTPTPEREEAMGHLAVGRRGRSRARDADAVELRLAVEGDLDQACFADPPPDGRAEIRPLTASARPDHEPAGTQHRRDRCDRPPDVGLRHGAEDAAAVWTISSVLFVANLDRDWPSANRFFVHDACLRSAAHPSVRARVDERLDHVVTDQEIARYEEFWRERETPGGQSRALLAASVPRCPKITGSPPMILISFACTEDPSPSANQEPRLASLLRVTRSDSWGLLSSTGKSGTG